LFLDFAKLHLRDSAPNFAPKAGTMIRVK